MRPVRPKNTARRKAAVAAGFRSGLEADIAADLDKRGIKYAYEASRILYVLPVRMGSCEQCGSKSVGKRATYTPDFDIGEFHVEAKGRFTSRDRTKLLAVRRCAGSREIRLLFSADNYTTGKRRERYSGWASRNDFVFHVGKTIPPEWCGGAEANPALQRVGEVLPGRTRSRRKPKLHREPTA